MANFSSASTSVIDFQTTILWSDIEKGNTCRKHELTNYQGSIRTAFNFDQLITDYCCVYQAYTIASLSRVFILIRGWRLLQRLFSSEKCCPWGIDDAGTHKNILARFENFEYRPRTSRDHKMRNWEIIDSYFTSLIGFWASDIANELIGYWTGYNSLHHSKYEHKS